jgi:hypothetical protein
MSKRRSAAEWSQIVKRWRASGLSAREYAERDGLVASTLSWWGTRVGGRSAGRDKRRGAVPGPSSFTELRVVAGRPEWSVIEVAGPRGLVVRVRGEVEERALLRVLRAVSQC